MRVERIWVKGLFGMFDHDVPLRMKERITILHGLNGLGKTVLLEMTNSLLSGLLLPFFRTPFLEFGMALDNGGSVHVRSSTEPADDHAFSIEAVPGGVVRILRNSDLSAEDSPAPEPGIASILHWREDPERLLLNIREVTRKALPSLAEIQDSLAVFLVETDRLLQEDQKPTVKEQSKHLVERIKVTVAQYAERSAELDRTFPLRMLARTQSLPLEPTELTQRLAALDQKRARFVEFGILPAEEKMPAAPPAIDPGQRGLLTVFVEDMEQKLSAFDDLAERIALLTSMINERFQYKRLTIHREHGMVFTSDAGAPIDPAKLSSGEQHELILLYSLLFQVAADSLILIDEPELSLHVAWQNQIVGDLEKLTALSHFDVILATHSIDVINGRWDLAVALTGPPRK